MKRNALVIASIAVLSTSAHASKARMEALGQDSIRGSEYISDTRNIFRNPALLNRTTNYLITEWGSSTAADDAPAAPRAEGGFFREMGSFNYGLYLGNNESDNDRNDAATFLRQDNAIDLFLSGDMGIQWGARLHYSNATDETQPAAPAPFKRENSALGIGLGATMGDAEAYLNLTLSDKSTGNSAAGGLATDEYKTKPSYLVGGSYKWASVIFFANYEANKADLKVGTTTTKIKDSEINIGAGRVHELNPTARIFTDARITYGTVEPTQAATVVPGKDKYTILPVTIGFETDATSWLALRGNVHQNVILNTYKFANGKKQSFANTTNVDAGATLNFGKLKIDGSIGTTGSARNSTTAAEQGVLATDNLLTRVGVTYTF